MKFQFKSMFVILLILSFVMGCTQGPSIDELNDDQFDTELAEIEGEDQDLAGMAYKSRFSKRIQIIGCEESDGGKNLEVSGSVKVTFSFKKKKMTWELSDKCRRGYLIERYCDGLIYKRSFEKCEHGCENGACVVPEPTCTDSDEGKKYEEKGEVIYCTNGAECERVGDKCVNDDCEILIDSCIDLEKLNEEYCDGIEKKSEEYSCPGECKEGECVEKVILECNSNDDCTKDNEFCELSGCEGSGLCTEKPDACTEDYQPVCGCNEVTYSNDCKRQSAGVSKSASGECVVTYDPEKWQIKTDTNIFEISENLVGDLSNKETIRDMLSDDSIGKDELPNTLSDETASNAKGDEDYEQRMYFESEDSGYVIYEEDDNDLVADFLYFMNGEPIARYELEFMTPFESDVDNEDRETDSDGTILTDFETNPLTLLGKKYTIVQARRLTTSGSSIKLILMSGSIKDMLLIGNTNEYTVDGNKYEITLGQVTDTKAKFTINGEVTPDMNIGDTFVLSDGLKFGVADVMYQDYSGGTHAATFFLDVEKVELRDDNIENSESSNELKVSDNTIDGANVIVEGEYDSTIVRINKIIVEMLADDDYYVPAGAKLSENSELSEPELIFTQNWDIIYEGLSEEDYEEIVIKPEGNDNYELEFIDGDGDKVSLPLVQAVSGSELKLGDDDDDDLILSEDKKISVNDYFILTDSTEKRGERVTYALQYSKADKISDDGASIEFENLGNGETIDRQLEDSEVIAEIRLGGQTFNVYLADGENMESDDFNISIDLDGDGDLGDNGDFVQITTKYGAELAIELDNDQVDASLHTPDDDSDGSAKDTVDDLFPTDIEGGITASDGILNLQLTGNHNFKTPENEDDVRRGYTSYGAYVKFNEPGGDPNSLEVKYPENQLEAKVFVLGGSS